MELLARLSAREREVLQLLQQGLPNKIISYRLGISMSTVKAHISHIIARLEVHNRTEAAIYGGQEGRLAS